MDPAEEGKNISDYVQRLSLRQRSYIPKKDTNTRNVSLNESSVNNRNRDPKTGRFTPKERFSKTK